jgi:hypothetical protein
MLLLNLDMLCKPYSRIGKHKRRAAGDMKTACLLDSSGKAATT